MPWETMSVSEASASSGDDVEVPRSSGQLGTEEEDGGAGVRVTLDSGSDTGEDGRPAVNAGRARGRGAAGLGPERAESDGIMVRNASTSDLAGRDSEEAGDRGSWMRRSGDPAEGRRSPFPAHGDVLRTPPSLRLRRTMGGASGGHASESSPLMGHAPHFGHKTRVHHHLHDYEDNDLEVKREELSTLFGFKPTAAIISRAAAREHRQKVKSKLAAPVNAVVNFAGQVLWLALFGWWLSLLYLVAALFMALTIVGLRYARSALAIARFVLWPFGVFLVRDRTVTMGVMLPEVDDGAAADAKKPSETSSLVGGTDPSGASQNRPWSMQANIGFVLWWIPATMLLVAHALCWAICWFFVVTIPLSKISHKLLFLLPRRDIVQLRVEPQYPGAGAEILMFANQSVNRYYVQHSIYGFNIVLLNLLPLVLVSLVVGYIFPLIGLGVVVEDNPIAMAVIMLLSIIPLSYYIGLAIASLAAQTNAAIGSVLNATFGSAVELILYCFALNRGLHDIVTGGIIGSLLGCTLLLPGLSMVAGGFKYQTQYFNQASAGVSSVMLTVSIVGAFTPTVFYQAYGDHRLHCERCDMNTTGFESWTCAGCRFTQFSNFDDDEVWTKGARPLMYAVSGLLPVAYLVGILFVLKTHTKIIYDDGSDDGEGGHGGHEAPEWSKTRCVIYLVGATVLLALIAEELVNVLEPTMKILHLEEFFVGLVVVALVPSTAEFVNAIRFALEDNIALSVEVGSAYGVQTALIQIPVLVWYSAIANHGQFGGSFVLVFDQLATFAIIIAVITFNYITTSSDCNYFQGASLVIIYLIFILAFFFAPTQKEAT
jgi:Ca2+:H+ antiporter